MSAFNDLDGVPASGNAFTLTQVLRGEWGFRGFVVSDYNAVHELINHGIAADGAAAAALALPAGVDMEMVSRDYAQNLPALIKAGKVPMSAVDEAVRRVLRVKVQLGLFDAPFVDPDKEDKTVMSAEHVAIARRSAERAIVLLKNERAVLPLRHDVRAIAVVGPLADNQVDLLGAWSAHGRAESVVPMLASVRAAAPKARVSYAKGCGTSASADDAKSIDLAVKAARSADVVIAAVGETFDMSGEAASRATLNLPGRQEDLVRALVATGKPVVVVLMAGRPLSIPWVADHAPAIVEAWHLGVQAGPAIAAVLFGDVDPAGRLPVSFRGRRVRSLSTTTTRTPGVPRRTTFGGPRNTSMCRRRPSTRSATASATRRSNTGGFGCRPPACRCTGRIDVSVDVANTGQRDGDEVVQLYVHQVVRRLAPPVRELKGFERVFVPRGASRR